MAQVMLSWGGFNFNIDSAAYNQLVRTWQWRWSGQTRIGQSDLLQCTGKAPVKVSLNGEVAPVFRNVGTEQIKMLAKMGDDMKPLLMVSGLGEILGYWVLTDLTETNTNFVQGGSPRLQTFTGEFAFYGDDLQNP
ncbi:phage tail protein [Enterovibrio norvegicus]|uniref:phage tail protein n=1 Tax=Enterovibrio norvegicus TaxID=188144 RepID=UPI0035543E52